MHEDDRQRSHEELWKSQEDESVQISTEEVCARARRREKTNVRSYWVLFGATALFVVAFIHNLLQFRQPWLIVGTAWVLAACCYIGWRLVRKGPVKMAPAEPCVLFLRRGFEAQRQALLWLRRLVLLLVPGILALWWGGGPVLGLKAWGIESPRLLQLVQGPLPLIVLAVMLSFVWFAFWKEGRKVDREIEKLGTE
jgi:hypothetical protein